MSDIFRILSRGTNLHKKASVSNSDGKFLPSAGAPPRPQVLASYDASLKAEPDNITTKKRKRVLENSLREYADRGQDSFEGKALGVEDDVSQNKSLARGPKTSKNDGPILHQMPRRSEVDRKKILKTHKLKIHVMSYGQDKSSADQRKKRTNFSLSPVFPDPLLSFKDLRPRFNLSRRLLQNIENQAFTIPTEVQLGSLPLLLGSAKDIGLAIKEDAKNDQSLQIDLLSIAPTGSGKSLAFLIPVIQQLLNQGHENRQDCHNGVTNESYVKAVVIVPTHELMDQIVSETRKLIFGTKLKVSAMKRGMKLAQHVGASLDDTMNIAQNVVKSDIIVSTPLVLLNTLEEKGSHPEGLPSVISLVLDEADVLLDPLFREQTLGVWKYLSSPMLRVSLWSATIGSSIESLVQETILERRKKLNLDSSFHYIVRLIVGLKDSALPTIAHKLVYAASEQGKLIAIRQLLHPTAGSDSQVAPLRPPFIVFTQTIARATALHSELLYDIPFEAGGPGRIAVIHSNLSDSARSDVMAGFRKGEIWLVITTDLLARGIDFRGVNGIVNYDMPNSAAAYVHRAGRTGRAGREGGIAVTLYSKEDIPYLRNIANVIANSDRLRGKSIAESEMPKWLLQALPNVSKKSRQELKQNGVAARRTLRPGDDRSREARRTRISTKSGFERRMENKKKGAIAASKQGKLDDGMKVGGVDDGDEWHGFD